MKIIGAKWSRALVLLLRKEKLRLHKSLVLKLLEEQLIATLPNAKQTHNQSINATNMY
jgi:hypothetical protein